MPDLIKGGSWVCEQGTKMVVQLLVDRPRVVLVDDCKNAKSKVVVLQTCFMAKHTYLANGDQQGHAHLQGVVRRGGCSGWRVVRPVCVLFASCLIAQRCA
jgi:hypothetical protein